MALEYLGNVKERLQREGVLSVEESLLYGPAAAAIVDAVQQAPDSIIAMTTHGRSGIGRWVLGSVAERVVGNSERPVLLIRAVETEADI